jgi:hypothetical protein
MKKIASIFLILVLSILFDACGGSDNYIPSPINQSSVGELGKIRLTWDTRTEDYVVGYNVYRSTSPGGEFVKLNDSVLSVNRYEDIISSPEGDCVIYYYKVTTVSDTSETNLNLNYTTANMHGTRLEDTYSIGFESQDTESPYVAEGLTTVDGGNFVINSSHKLCMFLGGKIDLEEGRTFQLNGLIRTFSESIVEGITLYFPITTITSHKTGGGTLDNGHGLSLVIDGAPDYNEADGSGTLLQNLRIENVADVDHNSGNNVIVRNSSPKFYQSKIYSNSTDGNSFFKLDTGASPVIKNCYFENIVLSVVADLRSSDTSITSNRFRDGIYSIDFEGLANPAISSGQIAYNDFDGSKSVYLSNMTGGNNIPLGYNYWFDGTGSPPVPAVVQAGTTSITANYDPALSGSAADTGPWW